MKELICIVCPKGCRLRVDDENGYVVTGNSCERGSTYGTNELRNPVRVVTSTVVLEEGLHRRLPVKTNAPVPKGKIFEVMNCIGHVKVSAPILVGTVLLSNVAGTGADLVATKTVEEN